MKDRDRRVIEAKLEAAFDRYSSAVLSGTEPTSALLIESLQSEGLNLSLSRASASAPDDRRATREEDRIGSMAFGRRAGDLLAQRIKDQT